MYRKVSSELDPEMDASAAAEAAEEDWVQDSCGAEVTLSTVLAPSSVGPLTRLCRTKYCWPARGAVHPAEVLLKSK